MNITAVTSVIHCGHLRHTVISSVMEWSAQSHTVLTSLNLLSLKHSLLSRKQQIAITAATTHYRHEPSVSNENLV